MKFIIALLITAVGTATAAQAQTKIGNLASAQFTTRCEGVGFSDDGSEEYALNRTEVSVKLASGAQAAATCAGADAFNNGERDNLWRLNYSYGVVRNDVGRLRIAKVRLFGLRVALNSGVILSDSLEPLGSTINCREGVACMAARTVNPRPAPLAAYHTDYRVTQLVLRAYLANGSFYEHRLKIDSSNGF